MTTISDLLRAARAVRAIVRKVRQEIEEAKCLVPPAVDGLVKSGLCRLSVPARLGEHEAEPVAVLKIYEELAGNQHVAKAGLFKGTGGSGAGTP
jgi:hypothetical protein